jgi:hypothetical protein
MSRIWDSLKHVEQNQIHQPPAAGAQLQSLLPERRCGERKPICLPVFVYGHSTGCEPFYESTEVLYANDSGGLITLQAPVAPGQKLLLTIKQSSKDQECWVIGVRSTYLNRSAVAVGFREPLLDAPSD